MGPPGRNVPTGATAETPGIPTAISLPSRTGSCPLPPAPLAALIAAAAAIPNNTLKPVIRFTKVLILFCCVGLRPVWHIAVSAWDRDKRLRAHMEMLPWGLTCERLLGFDVPPFVRRFRLLTSDGLLICDFK